MSRTLLSAADYKALLRDIVSLRDRGDAASSSAKVEAYWSIGKRIEKLRLSEEAGYHNSVIRDLAADSGLAMRTLHQSVKLAQGYKRPPKNDVLTWSHYRALLKLPSATLRDFYIQKTAENAWSSRQLEAAIRAGLHEGKAAKERALERPTDQAFTYEAKVTDIVDADTLDLDIDLGFGVARKMRARLAVVDAPALSSQKGRTARDFVAAQLMAARTVVIKSERADLHGRYIVHLFFTARQTTTSDCFKTGIYLNDLLVQKKHAIVVG